jgi:pilus assembly protein CpaB
VDVIQNIKMSGGSGDVRGPSQSVQTKVVMRNLTVLAIDQTVEPKTGSSTIVGATATLQIPAEQIDILAKAKEEGGLVLALRSSEDMTGAQGAAEPVQVLRHGPVHATSGPLVSVYRGAALSEVLSQ